MAHRRVQRLITFSSRTDPAESASSHFPVRPAPSALRCPVPSLPSPACALAAFRFAKYHVHVTCRLHDDATVSVRGGAQWGRCTGARRHADALRGASSEVRLADSRGRCGAERDQLAGHAGVPCGGRGAGRALRGDLPEGVRVYTVSMRSCRLRRRAGKARRGSSMRCSPHIAASGSGRTTACWSRNGACCKAGRLRDRP